MASTVATIESVRTVRKAAPDRRPRFRDNELDRLNRLDRFTHAYWLRPENAYWMTLRSLALPQRPFASPSVDVSCGDGVFSFLHAGGQLDPAFDVFGAVRGLDRVTNEYVDMFDCPPIDYTPAVTRKPDWTIDVGTDLKPAMLEKAAALDFYGLLVEHNNNAPLRFEDSTFATVYCNSAYWVSTIDLFLRELRRITRSDGRIILQVKTSAMCEYTLERFHRHLGQRFLEIIGRGRHETWPSLASRTEWEQRFERAGLVIQEALPFVTRTHAQIWDVGLRPIAPLLVRMANSLTPETRRSIKQDWCELINELLAPLCKPDFDLFGHHGEPAEIQYTLTPR